MKQVDVIEVAARGTRVNGHGKNFKSLIAAGSWVISGFRYGQARCACCGRPILHVLSLTNKSHEVSHSFPEKIEVGIICGPKIFVQSCVGFYEDPEREWDRQHRSWKDFIDYTVLCVKHENYGSWYQRIFVPLSTIS